MSPTWMVCSACRNEIGFAATYWECSVSTCNRARVRLVFCSVACWDSHVAMFKHRDAWAVEAKAPQLATAESAVAPVKRSEASIVIKPAMPAAGASASSGPATGGAGASAGEDGDDILVVVSRMKKYIRDKSGMNVSDGVAAALSEHVRMVCDLAIRMAGVAGRKTVMDRDVPPTGRKSG